MFPVYIVLKGILLTIPNFAKNAKFYIAFFVRERMNAVFAKQVSTGIVLFRKIIA